MRLSLPICAVVVILILSSLVLSVTAARTDKIEYTLGLYGETDDYSLVPPIENDSAFSVIPHDTIMVGGKEVLSLPRYPLVGYAGTGVEVVLLGFTTAKPLAYQSDLSNYQVQLNGQLLSNNTIPNTEGSVLKIYGNIPADKKPDDVVHILTLPDSSSINTKLLMHVISQESEIAKKGIFTLDNNIKLGDTSLSETDLSEIVNEYNSKNFGTAAIKSEIATEKGVYRQEGMKTGLMYGGLIAFAALVVGLILGYWQGRKKTIRYDLLNLETVILRYFNVRNEKLRGNLDMSLECTGMFERAFEFNVKRAEEINRALKHQVIPDFVALDARPDMRPSLFQAFFEKSTYAKPDKFNQAIHALMTCLKVPVSEEKVTLRKRLRGIFKKQ